MSTTPDYELPNLSTDLSGTVALVTGATSGLGRRFARVIADAGAAVAVTGRRAEKLKELQGEIEGAFHYDRDGAALYSTTKAAINRMTETLAVEWVTKNVNVNAIAPVRSIPR